jgi:serine/threonine protein kinase
VTLGTGSFGRVLRVNPNATSETNHPTETDQSGTFMALKIIEKARVIKTRQVDHTIAEKNILFSMDNRFLVKMYDYFTDSKAIFMLLEFVNGGEMFTHIQKQKRRRLDELTTRHFAAQTVLAFEYMHNLDIIFRDLKPENMLISSDGHIKVTDFGFAKRVDDRTWTMCGTPEYLAPEIIVNKGYNHAVDWWAVGVLIFEMRCGQSTFFHLFDETWSSQLWHCFLTKHGLPTFGIAFRRNMVFPTLALLFDETWSSQLWHCFSTKHGLPNFGIAFRRNTVFSTLALLTE